MYIEFYLDVFFAVNFLLDFLLLCLTNLWMKGNANPLKSLLGAMIGSVGMCLFVLLAKDFCIGNILLFYGGTTWLMVFLGCGCRNFGSLLLEMGIFWGGAFLMGGFLNALPYKNRQGVLVFFLITIAAYGILYICIRLFRYLKGKEPLLCSAVVTLGGKEIKTTGLYDTGNRLADHITGKYVSVMEYRCLSSALTKDQKRALEQFCSMETAKEDPEKWLESLHPRFLLYSSVGRQKGLLPVITVDGLTVEFQGKKTTKKNALIGISMETISLDRSYTMIISPGIWEH